jgi:hypothetical protein
MTRRKVNPESSAFAQEYGGMSKREFVATQIMRGLATNPEVVKAIGETSASVMTHAILAVNMADALFEALNLQPPKKADPVPNKKDDCPFCGQPGPGNGVAHSDCLARESAL